MSAPDTNIDKQKRRHWAPLVGSVLVAVFGIAMILWWLTDESAQAPGPETAPPAEATGDIGDSTQGRAGETAPTTGGDTNTSGSQPGVEIDQGSSAPNTPSTIGSPPPAGSE